MKNTILFTVAFPQLEKYYRDFFRSVKEQDSTDFDLLIINEGVDLKPYLVGLSIQVIELTAIGTIVGNRQQAFQYILEQGYANCICLDIDDFCAYNRISVIRSNLEFCDVYVHDMYLVDEFGQMFQNYFIGNRMASHDILFSEIAYKNFIGFGNMGMKVEFLKKVLPLPIDILAVDWWVASVACLHGAHMWYEAKPLTYYRQYSKNIAGGIFMDEDQIDRQLKIVVSHYTNLLARYNQLIPKKLELFEHTKRLEQLLNPDRKTLVKPMNDRNSNLHLLWWEQTNYIDGVD